MSDKSEIPLLLGDVITIEENDLNTYKELLRVKTDPNRILYIRDIKIENDDTTSLPEFRIKINGTKYLDNFPLLGASMSLGFGSDLRGSDTHDPLVVYVRKTNAGTGAMKITCVVTGTQIVKRK